MSFNTFSINLIQVLNNYGTVFSPKRIIKVRLYGNPSSTKYRR